MIADCIRQLHYANDLNFNISRSIRYESGRCPFLQRNPFSDDVHQEDCPLRRIGRDIDAYLTRKGLHY